MSPPVTDDAFAEFEQTLQSAGPAAGFDFLARRFITEKNYPQLFELRLIAKRRELDLPLLERELPEGGDPEKRRCYEAAFLAAAREVGGLFLADGDIARAWPYFRAAGDRAPVAAAIEQLEPRDGIDQILEIAFHEQVNPRKGFELILKSYGICRAITFFGQYPGREGRDDSLRLLVRTLHGELVASLKRAIERQEGAAPETTNVRELMAGREFLFADEMSYYVDTSHVVAVLRASLDLDDHASLALALELADYGQRLGPMYHYAGDPPFENVYRDHAIYLHALLGEQVEEAVAHFRAKVISCDPNQAGTVPAQVLVDFLSRLGRHREAVEVSVENLSDVPSSQLACPSVFELCQSAGDFDRLRQIARARGDLLSFAAGALAGSR